MAQCKEKEWIEINSMDSQRIKSQSSHAGDSICATYARQDKQSKAKSSRKNKGHDTTTHKMSIEMLCKYVRFMMGDETVRFIVT